ncbi:MAG: SPASM domain-containing protein [Bacteroidetes bacterium]|nr:SPASM domain-containing protein [Bacteroidota bacterium]
MAIDSDVEFHNKQSVAWLEKGVDYLRVDSMSEGISCAKCENFMFIVINADNVDYLPKLPYLRKITKSAILIATSNFSIKDYTTALNFGADSFGVISENLEENTEIINTIIKKLNRQTYLREYCEDIILYKNIKIFPKIRKVLLEDLEISLSKSETLILCLLASKKDVVFSYEQIYEYAFCKSLCESYIFPEDAIKSTIKRIRKKFGSRNIIKNIWGLGYQIGENFYKEYKEVCSLKPSRYNHFFPYSSEQNIAYNALSNSLALIDKSKLSEFMNFYNQGSYISDELVSDLKKGAFLVNSSINELDVLRYRMQRARYNTDSLSMTIAPTNDCQFACVYCYEKDAISSKYMTIEVQDRLVKMLDARKGLISSFSVVWYGGEPLMAFDVVESLSSRFIEICENSGIHYNAVMVSNGYMLNVNVLSRMKKLKISMIQVTVDGLPEVHDKMRPLKSGNPTFETIMSNLKNNYDILPSVALRINIDKDNILAGENIYKFLQHHDMLGKIRPYFGKIMSEAGTYNNSQCLSMCDFSEIMYDFTVQTSNSNDQSPILYPTLKSATCGADSVSSFVIDSEGMIYKCWCDIGQENRAIGNVLKEIVPASDLLLKYMLFDPTTSETCGDCNVLPICMGGCPYKRVVGSSDNCTNHKYILQKCLNNAVSFFKNKDKNQDICS